MSDHQHLPGLITWAQDWSEDFQFGIDARAEVPAFNVSDSHPYEETTAGAVVAGTMLDELADAIAAAFSSGSPGISSIAASWVLDESIYPKWRMDITTTGSPSGASITETGDDLTRIGLRVPVASPTIALDDLGGGVFRLESNAFTAGMWCSGRAPKYVPDTEQIVRVGRSPFYPSSSTKVRLGSRADFETTYHRVDAAVRSANEREYFTSLQERAGLYIPLVTSSAEGTLEKLIEAAAYDKGINFHVDQGVALAVDLDGDLRLSALSTDQSAGGAHYKVTLPFVGV